MGPGVSLPLWTAVTLFSYVVTHMRANLWVCFGGGVIGLIIRGVWLRARCVNVFFLQRLWGVVSFRPVSASSLHLLLGFQVWSINPVVCGGPYPS